MFGPRLVSGPVTKYVSHKTKLPKPLKYPLNLRSFFGLCFFKCHVVMKGISNLWFLITVLTNSVWFSVFIIWLWQKPQVYTQSKNTREREQNTTSPTPGRCNIFHSCSFYVGFKHAISQFNPIFPAFGALQWNRFHLILNIWSLLPLETPHQSCAFFFFKEAVNGKPPAPQCKPLSIIFSEHSNW